MNKPLLFATLGCGLAALLGAPTIAAAVGARSAAGQDAVASAPAAVDGTRAALEQYVELRRTISAERNDWKLGRELLEDRIELVGDEIASLRERIVQTQAEITTVDEERAELVAALERARSATAVLDERIVGLERRVLQLLARLPEPLRNRVQPLSQRFPTDPETTEAGLAERFQNVVGVLNEINKFQREITVTSELRELADGTSAEVAVLYLGIAQAFYVNNKGTSAGSGRASDSAWVWTPDDAIAEQVATAIRIFNNEEGAAFIELPVSID